MYPEFSLEIFNFVFWPKGWWQVDSEGRGIHNKSMVAKRKIRKEGNTESQ